MTTLDPSAVSSLLRRIASNPGRDPSVLVRKLSILAGHISGDDSLLDGLARRIAADIVKIAEDEVDIVSPWSTEEGEDVNSAFEFARGKHEEDPLESALKLLKRKIDRFIGEMRRSPSEEKKPGLQSEVVTSAP